MAERTIVEVNGRQYQVGRLPALTQLHVARRLMPCLAGLSKMASKFQGILPEKAEGSEAQAEEVLNEVITAVGQALSGMSDEDVDYIVKTCLKICYYQQDDKTWAPMTNSQGLIMNADLQLPDLLGVTVEVIKENLGGFFRGDPAS